MCSGKNMNVMVMDVEGTDGRERGEDQVRFIFSPNLWRNTTFLSSGLRTQVCSVFAGIFRSAVDQLMGAPSWIIPRS